MASTETPAPQLVMKRKTLDGLPELALPDRYALRTCREGDGVHWARILNESFGGERTVDDFVATMVNQPCYRPDRLFFICAPDGLPCATAGAYRFDPWGPQTGYLHYVGVCPGHQGRRLGYAVSLAVLHKFREEGCADAVLQTDDFRLPAIKTYLRLGFHPYIVDDGQPARWATVLANLEMG